MTERSIQRQLKSWYVNYDYKLTNVHMFSWETDFFAMTKSGYSIEIEIKCSRADFKKEFECKLEKHRLLMHHKKPFLCIPGWEQYDHHYDRETNQYISELRSQYFEYKTPAKHIPNRFYFCCPEGLIKEDDVPGYAGLLYVTENGIVEVRKAPLLHKIKRNFTADLLSKYYHRHINLKRELHIFLHRVQHLVEREGFKDAHKELLNKIG